MSRSKTGRDETALHKALSHPLRTRILLELERNGKLSPSRFATNPPPGQPKVSLNLAAYHFRVLLNFDAIEPVEEIQRRGAMERIYAINPGSPVLDVMHISDFLQQVVKQRSDISGRGIGGDTLTVIPIGVDGEGREELKEVLAHLKGSLAEVAGRCRDGLRSSSSDGHWLQVGFAAVKSASQRRRAAQVLSEADRW